MSEITTWMSVKSPKKYPKLTKDITADIAIIGGGMAGIISGYLLTKAGFKTVLLECTQIGRGVTAYTTAFLTEDIDTDLTDLKKMFGKRKAKLIWDSHQSAIDLIEQIIKAEKIECNFMRCPLYAYANTPDEFKTLEKENETAHELGFPTFLSRKNILNFPNAGSLKLKNQAKFNPEKFLYTLAEKANQAGLEIYENTEITKLTSNKAGVTLQTSTGAKVKANTSITTTYKPLKNPIQTFGKKGMYESFVFEIEVPKGLFEEALYLDTENPYHYFRIDSEEKSDRMIIGGEDYRSELKFPKDKSFTALEEYLKKIMDSRKYKIITKWSGPILEPSDGLALIGQYKEHEWVATAFSGNGMTYSGISAMIFRDMAAGKKNAWAELYNPRRIPSIKQLAFKAYEYGQELVEGAGKNTFVKGKKKFKEK